MPRFRFRVEPSQLRFKLATSLLLALPRYIVYEAYNVYSFKGVEKMAFYCGLKHIFKKVGYQMYEGRLSDVRG